MIKLNFQTGILLYKAVSEGIEFAEAQFSNKSGPEKKKEAVEFAEASFDVLAQQISLNAELSNEIKKAIPDLIEQTVKAINSLKGLFNRSPF